MRTNTTAIEMSSSSDSNALVVKGHTPRTRVATRLHSAAGMCIGLNVCLRVCLQGLVLSSTAFFAGSSTGCSSSKERFVSDRPLADLKDSKADARLRVNAVDQSRAQAGDDLVSLNATITAYKDVLWRLREPVEVREKILDVMLSDPNPVVVEAARAEGRNLLPLETSRRIVIKFAAAAADRGWTEYNGPLIRSWAKAVGQRIGEDDRAERAALIKLNPGKEPIRIVLDSFVNPPEPPPGSSSDWLKRFRRDAWDLLARLDDTGSARMDLITNQYASASADPAVIALRRSAADLGAIPITGDELSWLTSLVDPEKPENVAWWEQAKTAVARARSKGPFEIRHAEALRWAMVNTPARLNASREELMSELRARLDTRTLIGRKSDQGGARVRDRIDDWKDSIKWADLLTILVIDDAISTPGLMDTLYTQSAMDMADTTTEYGGIIGFSDQLRTRKVTNASSSLSTARSVAVLFPPRPRERQGDNKFVASTDMISASDRALIHYHFHVQQHRNIDYAGPSAGDLTYAARSGRNCIVITSISQGVLGIDYYQPDGKVIDLGTVEIAGVASR